MKRFSQDLDKPPKLKILQIGKFYKPYRGGMETTLFNLCDELNKNYDIEVLVANQERRTSLNLVEGVPVTRVASYGRLFSTSLCFGFPAELKKRRVDILHLHFPNPLAEISYLLSDKKTPLVISYHSDVLRPKRLYRFYKPLLKQLLHHAERIVVSNPVLLSTSDYLKDFLSKCSVIPFGIEISNYENSSDLQRSVEHLKMKYGDRLILFVGRFVYYKGLDILIQAMTQINGHLLLVGTGSLESSLQMLVRNLKLHSKVTFLGELSEEKLLSVYHACQLFVLPSTEKTEAFGLVQLEAMICGKPVVSTDLPSGVPWVNQEGITGYVVPPKNPSALVQAINQLLDHPDLAKWMGEQGKQRVKEFFSRERMASEYAKIYEDLRKNPEETFFKNHFMTRFFKRSFDILLSGLGILFAFPLACLFAIAVWLEDWGPIFYLQERMGQDGKIFKIIKFRSMIPEAEQKGPLQALRKDPRITWVGGLLRAIAMDELPQLINIFKGEMSFVGPRALRVEEIKGFSLEDSTGTRKKTYSHLRSRVRPGLTGVAQIFIPRDAPMYRKFRYDLFYIRKLNFWLDIKLIFISFLITFRRGWGKAPPYPRRKPHG